MSLTLRPVRLDRTRAYNRVQSLDGILRFEQDGKIFLRNGKQEGVEDNFPDDEVVADTQAVQLRPDGEDFISFAKMSCLELEILLDSFGEEFTTREAAITYLQGSIS